MSIYVDFGSFALEIITDLIFISAILNIPLKKTCHPIIYSFSCFIVGELLTHLLPDLPRLDTSGYSHILYVQVHIPHIMV